MSNNVKKPWWQKMRDGEWTNKKKIFFAVVGATLLAAVLKTILTK
jgi:hypothetical protein